MEYASQNYNAQQNISTLSGATTPVQPPTLMRAIAQVDLLNKRLSEMSAHVVSIAQSVGGPFPVSGDKHSDPPPVSAMNRLNNNIDVAHRQLNEIEHALSALQRTLGE